MSILSSVDEQTQLVGKNKLELLTFKLEGNQLYAINVFKVQEVQLMEKTTIVPGSHPMVVGLVHLRGNTIPVIDLNFAIGMGKLTKSNEGTLIVSEYNSTVQAFVVAKVDRIVNLNWKQIYPPPKALGRNHFVTAVTNLDENTIVEIIDIEKVLCAINNLSTTVSSEQEVAEILKLAKGQRILLVDDSNVARSQAKSVLHQLGFEVIELENGREALEFLEHLLAEGTNVCDYFSMVITDAEMPGMDGYSFTAECRKQQQLKDLYIVLHTSMSGDFNTAMAQKVGCDEFISKFQPDALARLIKARLQAN